MSVGTNIKKRRLELRMSQQDLADAMGYKTRSTITKIESGENDVSQKKLQKFAAILDTTVEALVSEYRNTPETEVSWQELSDFRRNKTVAVILAGGRDGENRQNVPSQFVSVHGKPVLVYCMEAYQAHPAVDAVYVVCLKGWESIVKAYADQYGITKLRGLVSAGTSGTASLKNAWSYLRKQYAPEDVVVIQEATRPQVHTELISKLLQACAENGSATICHAMEDYVQFDISGGRPEYRDRNAMIALQSPEAHKLSLLNEMFGKAAKKNHPLVENCCTMLLHHLGYEINFIEGGINNIKIVREEDLAAFGAMVRS